MKTIRTSKYIKTASNWDIYVNFWKSRDVGGEGHVLFNSPVFPETEDQVESLWKPKSNKKNKNRSNA